MALVDYVIHTDVAVVCRDIVSPGQVTREVACCYHSLIVSIAVDAGQICVVLAAIIAGFLPTHLPVYTMVILSSVIILPRAAVQAARSALIVSCAIAVAVRVAAEAVVVAL
jgi:hypothetical protein